MMIPILMNRNQKKRNIIKINININKFLRKFLYYNYL